MNETNDGQLVNGTPTLHATRRVQLLIDRLAPTRPSRFRSPNLPRRDARIAFDRGNLNTTGTDTDRSTRQRVHIARGVGIASALMQSDVLNYLMTDVAPLKAASRQFGQFR